MAVNKVWRVLSAVMPFAVNRGRAEGLKRVYVGFQEDSGFEEADPEQGFSADAGLW